MIGRELRWVPLLGSGLPPDGDVVGLGCDVDVETFLRSCRAPLVSEGWNVWLVNRTLTDNESVLAMQGSVERFVESQFGLLDKAGKIEHLRVISLYGTSVNVFQQHLDEKLRTELLHGTVLLRSRSQLPEMVTLVPGPSTQFAVAFVHRGGGVPSIPWPAGGNFDGCPRECIFTLEAAYKYADPPPVPKEDDGITLPDLSKAGKKIADALTPDFGIGTALAVTIVGGLAVAYLVRSFK